MLHAFNVFLIWLQTCLVNQIQITQLNWFLLLSSFTIFSTKLYFSKKTVPRTIRTVLLWVHPHRPTVLAHLVCAFSAFPIQKGTNQHLSVHAFLAESSAAYLLWLLGNSALPGVDLEKAKIRKEIFSKNAFFAVDNVFWHFWIDVALGSPEPLGRTRGLHHAHDS